ncbi:MAG: ABC transporter permease [Dehalococcoidia bacterium]|nr:ABC transporter permease [Dehalococcoidia bacterium]
MIVFSMVQAAVMALSTNKLRTTLTMLGIVIGVGAVIALMAAGQGAKQGVTKEVSGLGSNLIFVTGQRSQTTSSSGTSSSSGGGGATVRAFNPFSLTTDDADALKDNALLPYVEAVVAQYSLELESQLTGNGRSTTATAMTATQPDFPSVRSYKLAVGRFISEDDMSRKATNVVLGAQVAQDLFDTAANAIGKDVRMSFGPFSLNFTVVGVMEPRGAAGAGTDDTTILVPLTTFQARVPFGRSPTGRSNIQEIIVKVSSGDKVDQTKEAIRQVLLQEHDLSEDFTVQTQEDLTATARHVSRTLTILLGAIAGISLVVGGIGTMNIMLVSVAERTREIGIRKAVGANRQDIMLQFVVEALLVTVVGGAAGVVAGALAARVADGQTFGTGTEVTTLVTPLSIIVAFGVSAAIGLFFGIYPAFRASRLDPIEALRSE